MKRTLFTNDCCSEDIVKKRLKNCAGFMCIHGNLHYFINTKKDKIKDFENKFVGDQRDGLGFKQWERVRTWLELNVF